MIRSVGRSTDDDDVLSMSDDELALFSDEEFDVDDSAARGSSSSTSTANKASTPTISPSKLRRLGDSYGIDEHVYKAVEAMDASGLTAFLLTKDNESRQAFQRLPIDFFPDEPLSEA